MMSRSQPPNQCAREDCLTSQVSSGNSTAVNPPVRFLLGMHLYICSNSLHLARLDGWWVTWQGQISNGKCAVPKLRLQRRRAEGPEIPCPPGRRNYWRYLQVLTAIYPVSRAKTSPENHQSQQQKTKS